MTSVQQQPILNNTLWGVQWMLALFLLSGAVLKWMPIDQVAPVMPWMGQLPEGVVRLLGLLDLLGALGLVLPGLVHRATRLTTWAALGILVLMISASVFHVVRGEAHLIGVNIVAGILAIFIAWGRRFKRPL